MKHAIQQWKAEIFNFRFQSICCLVLIVIHQAALNCNKMLMRLVLAVLGRVAGSIITVFFGSDFTLTMSKRRRLLLKFRCVQGVWHSEKKAEELNRTYAGSTIDLTQLHVAMCLLAGMGMRTPTSLCHEQKAGRRHIYTSGRSRANRNALFHPTRHCEPCSWTIKIVMIGNPNLWTIEGSHVINETCTWHMSTCRVTEWASA